MGRALQKTGVLKTNLSILENNCMQSTASSAGYSTGSTMVSAIAALLMIQGRHLPFWTLMGWTVFLAMLGVMMAIPMKRQMINIEQLTFPSGIAAAETLRSLYAAGAIASLKARSLSIAGVAGALVAFFRDNAFTWWPGFLRIPAMVEFPGMLSGHRLAQWTISFEMSLIMIAAGAIVGIRVALSMFLGALLNYGFLAPMMYGRGVIEGPGYRSIVSWSLWGGTAIMVTAGILSFVFQWRTVGKAFSSLLGAFGRSSGVPGSRSATVDPPGSRTHKTKPPDSEPTDAGSPEPGPHAARARLRSIEVPATWFLSGVALATAGIVAIQVASFSIIWWMGLISVFMTFFLSVVACRATAETDVTPIGAMGKITQLFYGVVAPAETATNLMTACVTAGAAASSADLLTDLKSGYLLGANPRKQFIAQFLGIFAGALVIVPAFYLLVPTPEVLGSETFPAPAAQVWKSVAELLANGFESLHVTARWALAVGGAVGIVITVLERALPTNLRRFVPSAMGLGLAFVIPFWNTLSMFVGALTVWVLSRKAGPLAERYTIPVASGIIAGESLMGVVVALLGATGIMR
jgi:OPT family oligopeptide transporter